MGYSAQTFVAGEQPTTAKWNILWSNDASFNDGTGIGSAVIDSTKLARNVASGVFSVGATGNFVVTGVGFNPRVIIAQSTISNSSNAAWSAGYYDRIAGTQGCNTIDAQSASFKSTFSTTKFLSVQAPVGTIINEGTITATSSDGFTYNCATWSAATSNVIWTAYA